MLIANFINELTVWADSLEDQNIDVSLLRILSSYNYLTNTLSDGCFLNYYPYHMSLYIRDTHKFLNAYGNGGITPATTGDGWMFDYLDNYGHGPDNIE